MSSYDTMHPRYLICRTASRSSSYAEKVRRRMARLLAATVCWRRAALPGNRSGKPRGRACSPSTLACSRGGTCGSTSLPLRRDDHGGGRKVSPHVPGVLVCTATVTPLRSAQQRAAVTSLRQVECYVPSLGSWRRAVVGIYTTKPSRARDSLVVVGINH